MDIENNQSPYIVRGTDEKVECWSSKRLPFEPTGWLKKMREDLRVQLRNLVNSSKLFYAAYTSKEKAHFDLENVLFYNIGNSAFSKIPIRHLVFESIPERPNSYNGAGYPHYYLYQSNLIDKTYWLQTEVVSSWVNIHIPRLTSATKVHWIWYWMKKGQIEVKSQLNDFERLGLSLNIAIPKGISISMISVIKPLLDGIIASFQAHNNTDSSEVVYRLSGTMDVSIDELDRFLNMKSQAVLGSIGLVQPYRNFVKWNPADDRLVYIDIKIEDSIDHKWRHSGTLFKVEQSSLYFNKR